jgi:hypothetical protein
MRRGEYEQLIARMDQCADLQFVTGGPWHRGDTRLYRLLPADEHAPAQLETRSRVR